MSFENIGLLLLILIPLLVFFALNFIAVSFLGRKMRFSDYNLVPLNFTTLARNSPLSLAIAVAAFPDRSMIAFALVIEPLIELSVLGIISGIINKINKKN